ncbi:hypothetical protein HZY62_11225 [Maribacter polysiphoniae]|jgi:hypothetical protein|uniref:Uncharacterized protein n=1 Tax=Maribacter polysiphoniae TaxID=429344 RepID=A0A316E0G3_9FLAO|nr:hypothetical protein [Maribacter polysiphoniae]MBD1261163.1 hypothetical protein [Maribacter polysiphoniae]PWK23595.1 hypothetical protein LX92_02161 [Maribacter polysiphoniae]
MELDRIERLLEKYLEASTTIAEEKELRAYFSQESVASHLKQYAPMFQYFSVAKEERYTKELPLKKRSINYKWLSIAAMAVMLFGIYFGKEYQEKKEAEFAYNETKKALTLLADNFSRGTEKVAYLNEFENTKQKIYNKN